MRTAALVLASLALTLTACQSGGMTTAEQRWAISTTRILVAATDDQPPTPEQVRAWVDSAKGVARERLAESPEALALILAAVDAAYGVWETEAASGGVRWQDALDGLLDALEKNLDATAAAAATEAGG